MFHKWKKMVCLYVRGFIKPGQVHTASTTGLILKGTTSEQELSTACSGSEQVIFLPPRENTHGCEKSVLNHSQTSGSGPASWNLRWPVFISTQRNTIGLILFIFSKDWKFVPIEVPAGFPGHCFNFIKLNHFKAFLVHNGWELCGLVHNFAFNLEMWAVQCEHIRY